MLVVTDLRFHQNKIDIEETCDLIGITFSINTEENIFSFEIYIRNTISGDIKKFHNFYFKM